VTTMNRTFENLVKWIGDGGFLPNDPRNPTE
jgi:hypothetical protein